MNRQAFVLTIMVVLLMTLSGCAGLVKTPADSKQAAGLTAERVQAMIDEAVARDRAARKGDGSSFTNEGVSSVVQHLEAVDFNHPGIAVKREIRGCTIQMVLYADTDVGTAADACMQIYRRRSGGAIKGTPLLTVTQ